MPISIDDFESGDEQVQSRSTAELIVEFLWRNRDKAFTRAEVAEGIDRKPNTVGTNLTRLKDRGLVRHKGTYWAITDDSERLREAYDLSGMLRRLEAEDGGLIEDSADAQAWREAQPEDPHPHVRDSTADDSDTDTE